MKFAPDLLCHNGEMLAGKVIVISPDGLRGEIADAALHPDAVPLPNQALFPGLVNAHSHAFQLALRGVAEAPGDFWSWRDAMYRAALAVDPEKMYDVALAAYREMIAAGITTVGEFHYIHRDKDGRPYNDPNRLALVLVEAARAAGIRICLLRSAYFRAGYNLPANPGQRRFIESVDEFLANTRALLTHLDGVHAWAGVAPHSIRAVPLPDLRRIADFSKAENLPLHIHAAEQPAEIEACRAEYGVTPITLLARERMLTPRTTVVHAIHISRDEIRALADLGATVCACPSTERNLGDGIVPADALLNAGVPVALGTDSQTQIDLLDDARQLEYHLRLRHMRRGVLAESVLWKCATEYGDRSLGNPSRNVDYFAVDIGELSKFGNSFSLFSFRPSLVGFVLTAGKKVPQFPQIKGFFRTIREIQL